MTRLCILILLVKKLLENMEKYLPKTLLVLSILNLIILVFMYLKIIGYQNLAWLIDLAIPTFLAIYALVVMLALSKLDTKRDKEEIARMLGKDK